VLFVDRIEAAIQERSRFFRALRRPLQARAGRLEAVAHGHGLAKADPGSTICCAGVSASFRLTPS